MSFTNYLETAVLNHVFRNTAMTSPTTVYAAVFTAAPDETGGGTEATGAGYARQAVTWDAPADDGSGGMEIANSDAVSFTASGGSFGDLIAIGYFDAATNGNLLDWATYSTATIGDGDTISFAAGALTISLS